MQEGQPDALSLGQGQKIRRRYLQCSDRGARQRPGADRRRAEQRGIAPFAEPDAAEKKQHPTPERGQSVEHERWMMRERKMQQSCAERHHETGREPTDVAAEARSSSGVANRQQHRACVQQQRLRHDVVLVPAGDESEGGQGDRPDPQGSEKTLRAWQTDRPSSGFRPLLGVAGWAGRRSHRSVLLVLRQAHPCLLLHAAPLTPLARHDQLRFPVEVDRAAPLVQLPDHEALG